VIRLARAAKLSVVAEGVETPEQLEILQRLGCEAVQGFFLGRPMSALRASNLLIGV
jgi:EAL domain-containing protein (putative c-di-GMP-specific phosphodiesterase class I)